MIRIRTLAVPTAVLALAMATPAWAQGQTSGSPQTSGGSQPRQTQGQQAQGQPSGGQQTSGQDQRMATRSHQAVEDALRQAGIEEVRTLNAAYLVSAITKDGEQMTFVVDPPPTTTGSSGSGDRQGQQAGSGQQASGQQTSGQPSQAQPSQGQGQQMALRSQQQVRDDLTKAGFRNVQILDATYLATGRTKNGDRITMMIDPTASPASGSSGGMSAPSSQGDGGSAPRPGQGGQNR